MKLIPKDTIDRARWDNLVLKDANASIYCQSLFLDHLAENWMLLINEDYSCGIPIPFTVRLGVKGIYTPNFIRTVDWVGLTENNRLETIAQAESILKNNFKLASLRTLKNHFSTSSDEWVFQELEGTIKLNSQAKRSCKKFQKSDLTIELVELNTVLPIVSEELMEKVVSLRIIDIQRFESFLESFPEAKMKVFGTKRKDEILGGLIFIEWKNTFHYVKGGARKEAKDQGAMYAMMEFAIDYGLSKGLKIDFGGSNVKGVRQFNAAFGGVDVPYFEWKWDNSPFWFKTLKALKNKRN